MKYRIATVTNGVYYVRPLSCRFFSGSQYTLVLALCLLVGCYPDPSDKEKIFGKGRTLVMVPPDSCIAIDELVPIPSEVSLLMIQDYENKKAAFRMAGELKQLYLGEERYEDSAIINKYVVELFLGDSCRGESICFLDSTFVFQAFRPATYNDYGMLFMEAAGHDNGILASMQDSCSCPETESDHHSQKITVYFTIHRRMIFPNSAQNNRFEGRCTFCLPCQLISI